MRLPLALTAAVALSVGCTQTVYVVQNPDGTFSEVPPPDPGGDADEVITVELASSNDYVLVGGDGEIYLVVDVRAQDHAPAARLPVDVALVVDRSGSMQGDKMEAARAAARSLVDELADGDRVALLSYASDVSLDHPLVALDARSRRALARAIDQLEPVGGTAIGAALEAGAGVLAQTRRARGLARMLLVSDGRPTVGETAPYALEGIAGRVGEVAGVSITTFGVGYDYNEDLMTGLAIAGGGNYYYVEHAAHMAAAFERELRSLGGTVAHDVAVTLALDPRVRVREVYGFRHERRGDRLVVPMGALAAGERRRLLVALEVPPSVAEPLTVARGEVAFRRVADAGPRRIALTPARVAPTADQARVARGTSRAVVEKVEAVRNAELRRAVVEHLDRGEVAAAQRIVGERLGATRRAHDALGGAALAREVEAVDRLARDVAAPPARSSDSYRHLRKSVKEEAHHLLLQ